MNELERMCAEVAPPAPETLAAGRHRLLNEMRSPAPVRSRRPLFLAVLAACVTATVLLGVFVAVSRQGDHAVEPTGPPPWEAPIPWDRMRDGHYLYSRYVEITTDDRSPFWGKPGRSCPVRYEWNPVGGIRPGVVQIKLCGEETRKTFGYFEPSDPNEIRDGKPVGVDPQPAYVRTLPTDPDGLIAKVRADTENSGDYSWHEKVWERLRFVLVHGFVPEQLHATYYTALAKLPGVTVRRGTKDELGRPGVTLSKRDLDGRSEIVFTSTHRVLGERILHGGKLFSALLLLESKVVAKLPPRAPNAHPGMP